MGQSMKNQAATGGCSCIGSAFPEPQKEITTMGYGKKIQ